MEDMNTPGEKSTTSTSWRRPVAASVAALVVAIVALVAVGVAAAIEQAAYPPTCHGIGFGCTPRPTTIVALGGYIVGLPTTAVAWLATWVGWAVTRDRSDQANQAAAWWPVWVLAVGTGVLAVAVLSTAG